MEIIRIRNRLHITISIRSATAFVFMALLSIAAGAATVTKTVMIEAMTATRENRRAIDAAKIEARALADEIIKTCPLPAERIAKSVY